MVYLKFSEFSTIFSISSFYLYMMFSSSEAVSLYESRNRILYSNSITSQFSQDLKFLSLIGRFCAPFEYLKEGWFRPGDSGESGDEDSIFPAWYNKELAVRGQSFGRRHFFQIINSIFHAYILMGMCHVNARRVIISAGKTLTAYNSTKRFTANVLQIKVWYEEDLTDPSSPFHDSVSTTRSIHSTIAHNIKKKKIDLDKPVIGNYLPKSQTSIISPMWDGFKADLRLSHLGEKLKKRDEKLEGRVKFSQYDMLGGLWTYFCLPVTIPERMNIKRASEEDLYAFAHFWALIGYLLGIEDQFNIALQPDLKSVQQMCKKVFDADILPCLDNIDDEGKFATEKFIEGNMGIVPYLSTKEGFFLAMVEDTLGIPTTHLRKTIGWAGIGLRKLEKFFLRPFSHYDGFQNSMNYYMNMWIRVAGIKYFNIDGSDPREVVEKGFF